MYRLMLFLSVVMVVCAAASTAQSAQPAAVQAPPPVYGFPPQPGFPITAVGGSFFSSPTVVDVYRNGRALVMTGDSAGCIWSYTGRGVLYPGFPWQTNGRGNCDGGERINNSLAVGDIDGDKVPEIVAGTRGSSNNPGQRGKVWALEHDGRLIAGWPQEMDWSWQGTEGNRAEVYSVALANMTGSSAREIIAGTSNEGGNAVSLYAWYGNANLLPNYPNGYADGAAAGIFGHVAAGDVDNDGYAEIVVGRDHIYTHVYDADGSFLPNWPQLTYLDPALTVWGRDKYVEFTRTAPAVADLDNNGSKEIIIAGKLRDPALGGQHPQVSTALMVFNADGQRRAGWTVGKTVGAPITSDFPPNNAVTIVDLNHDDILEIVVAFEDGTIRAFREDGFALWSYDYAQGRRIQASEVVVADITGDRQFELIFGTYALESGANNAVGVQALTTAGQFLPHFFLGLTHENGSIHGVMAAPTVADIDNDCHVELLVHSRGGTLYAWETPGLNYPGYLPWPTSRQNIERTGEYLRFDDTLSGTPHPRRAHNVFMPLVRKGCR